MPLSKRKQGQTAILSKRKAHLYNVFKNSRRIGGVHKMLGWWWQKATAPSPSASVARSPPQSPSPGAGRSRTPGPSARIPSKYTFELLKKGFRSFGDKDSAERTSGFLTLKDMYLTFRHNHNQLIREEWNTAQLHACKCKYPSKLFNQLINTTVVVSKPQ
jgi:hypothetical protein